MEKKESSLNSDLVLLIFIEVVHVFARSSIITTRYYLVSNTRKIFAYLTVLFWSVLLKFNRISSCEAKKAIKTWGGIMQLKLKNFNFRKLI